MDSEDSRDGSGDSKSSSSSGSSSSRSRRSSSSDRSETSKKGPKSPPQSPPGSPGSAPQSPPGSPPGSAPQSPASPPGSAPQSPKSEVSSRSPSPESQSQISHHSPPSEKRPHSPDNLSGAHSDINSPEGSMNESPARPQSHDVSKFPEGPKSPEDPKSPDCPKSPSEVGSNVGSPIRDFAHLPGDVPKSPQSPSSSAKSVRGSPAPTSNPASPDSGSLPATSARIRSASPSSDRYRSVQSSPGRPVAPKETWRRHTKAEQKMVDIPRRSRSNSSGSSSSSCNKETNNKDPATEEISEGEMESDQEDRKSGSKSVASDKPDVKDINISHEDLSDVSDLDSGTEDNNQEQQKESKPTSAPASPAKPEVKVNGNEGCLQSSPKSDIVKTEPPKLDKVPQEKTSNTEDAEEQLDFEAEEGECVEPKPKEQANGDVDTQADEKAEEVKPGKRSRGSSLEEGEVSDEAERRPEENEPRPVCRFFSRGACTWGVSCRFLHPGVTDKGNYTMFEVIRGVPTSGYAPPREVAPPESAWERGLRTAKEMLRIANKRKEQDMDFEEKKLHLSVGGVVHDPDAELAYAAAAVGASPPPVHHEVPPYRGDPEMHRAYGGPGPGPMPFRGRFPRPHPADDRERVYYEREARGYDRERPYERPPHYDGPSQDMPYHKRRVRASREVIVQRAEVERREARESREAMRDDRMRAIRGERGERGERGDEWADPWMRAEPAARRRRPPSSDDSYSSSSSSNSSSRSSRSPGTRRKRRASSSSRQRLSPSVIVRERRLATARATAMNPPAPRRRAPSPVAARLAANPPAPASLRHKDEVDPYGRSKISSRNRDRKKYSSSSGSGSDSSSSSSESDSESRSSSTSGSSGARRARHARLLNAAARPRINTKSAVAAAVTIPNKKEPPSDKDLAKKRSANSPPNAPAAKKSVSRREELLKQLKAVEDAIARKRSKI